MPTREITLQLVLAFLFGAILLNLGLRGRLGSGLAALLTPDQLVEGDFSGGNDGSNGNGKSDSGPSLLSILLQGPVAFLPG